MLKHIFKNHKYNKISKIILDKFNNKTWVDIFKFNKTLKSFNPIEIYLY